MGVWLLKISVDIYQEKKKIPDDNVPLSTAVSKSSKSFFKS